MSLSVVIPFYDETLFVRQAVRSVLGLGSLLHEMIVVDDSPGKHDPFLSDLKTLDPRIVVVANPVNSGASASRNTGIAHASGAQVLFLDSDDVISSKGIADSLQYHVVTKADLTHLNTLVLQAKSGGLHQFNRDARLFSKRRSGLHVEQFPQIRYAVANWSFIFQTEFLKDNGVRFDPEQRMFEDHLFILHAAQAATRFSTSGVWGHVWRRRGGSLTTTQYGSADHQLQAGSIRKGLKLLSEHYGMADLAFQREVAFCLMRYVASWPTLYEALAAPDGSADRQKTLHDIQQAFAGCSLAALPDNDFFYGDIFPHGLLTKSGMVLQPSELQTVLNLVSKGDWAALSRALDVDGFHQRSAAGSAQALRQFAVGDAGKDRGSQKSCEKLPQTPPAKLQVARFLLSKYHDLVTKHDGDERRFFSEFVLDELETASRYIKAFPAENWYAPAEVLEIEDLIANFMRDTVVVSEKWQGGRIASPGSGAFSGDRTVPGEVAEKFAHALHSTNQLGLQVLGLNPVPISRPAVLDAWRALENHCFAGGFDAIDRSVAALADRARHGDADISGRRALKRRVKGAVKAWMGR